MGLEAADGSEGEVGEGGLEGEGGYVGVGAEGVGLEALRTILRVERAAYKPDWVDMFLFLTSSKTLELFGICGAVRLWDGRPVSSDVLVLRSRRRNQY